MQSSVNQNFPDDQCMTLQSHTWMNNPLKVQDRPEEF